MRSINTGLVEDKKLDLNIEATQLDTPPDEGGGGETGGSDTGGFDDFGGG